VATRSWLSYFAVPGFMIAVLSGLGAVFGGLGTRWDIWDYRTGLAVFKYAAFGGFAAFILSLIGLFSMLRFVSWRSFVLSLAGLIISLALVSISLEWYHQARSVPPIHDITTDTSNPPEFVAILPIRKNAPNSSGYGGPRMAEEQRRAYPDIVPLFLSVPPATAFDRALSVASQMGWRLVDADKSEGRIEAIATTFWFGFKDDVVIRIEKADSGSRVDIRSVSRVGVSDLGTNAKRIREFLREMTKA
jgi:uncharacterized protein (DUF1499 family)